MVKLRLQSLAIATVSLCLLAPVASLRAQDDTLTNGAIIELHQMGFGDEVLLEKIRSSPTDFDLSLEGLRSLKEAGIPQSVIAEMIGKNAMDRNAESAEAVEDPNDPLSPHSPGIYLFQESGEPRLLKLEPSVYSQAKSGGFLKHAFSYGVAKIKSKAILMGTSARLQLRDRKPTFYFYFEETETGLSYQSQATTSPAEFVLAELDVKDKKNHRELVVGQMNAFGAESGALDKTVRLLDFEEVADGIYRVQPQNSLTPGEYGFYYAGAAPMPTYGVVGSSGGRVFDFGVR